MGCGGSRMDVLEPYYLENWTKDTESTWLASTDTDNPLSSIQSLSSDTGFTSEKTLTPVADIFDEGLHDPAQAYVKLCSSLTEASLDEEAAPKTPLHPSEDPGGPPRVLALPPGSTAQSQRRSVPHTEETTQRPRTNHQKPTRQVSIGVTTQRSSRQQADIRRGSKMAEESPAMTTQATMGNTHREYGAAEEEEEEEREEEEREEEEREPVTTVR